VRIRMQIADCRMQNAESRNSDLNHRGRREHGEPEFRIRIPHAESWNSDLNHREHREHGEPGIPDSDSSVTSGFSVVREEGQ
jgi:hypothetical protein